MTTVGDLADDVGTGAGEPADEKERGAGAMAVQQIQETRCDCGVGPIVEGQRDRLRGWKTPEDRAE
jgi:hypothetical protein